MDLVTVLILFSSEPISYVKESRFLLDHSSYSEKRQRQCREVPLVGNSIATYLTKLLPPICPQLPIDYTHTAYHRLKEKLCALWVENVCVSFIHTHPCPDLLPPHLAQTFRKGGFTLTPSVG